MRHIGLICNFRLDCCCTGPSLYNNKASKVKDHVLNGDYKNRRFSPQNGASFDSDFGQPCPELMGEIPIWGS